MVTFCKNNWWNFSMGVSKNRGTPKWMVYIWASIARYPPPHPMVMGLYSSAPVPPLPPVVWVVWVVVGGGGWWWVVVYPPVGGVGGVGGGGWWWWKKLYMYVYECISTPLPPVVWVVWVVVGGGGGGRSCICMYMNVYVWYECIFLVFAYDYDMICIW